jgi:hypothetical protein
VKALAGFKVNLRSLLGSQIRSLPLQNRVGAANPTETELDGKIMRPAGPRFSKVFVGWWGLESWFRD